MKKYFYTTILICFALWQNAYAYDFSAVASSGQTLYYKIVGSGVAVTYPGSSTSTPYDGFSKPTGLLTIPSTVTNGGTTYSVTSIGSYALYGCNGLASVTIPNSVTSIGGWAFSGCSGITSITIGSSVTSVGQSAFANCNSLTSASIPNSVTSIGSYAFYNCSGLTSVILPNSITSIDGYTFYQCSGLTAVTIPNSVTSIGYYAFKGCSGLTSIIIPNSVTSIGSYAFYDCSGLSSVTVGNSLSSIGGLAFNGCINLTNINVLSGNMVYDSRDSCNAIIETASNTLIIGCKNTTIPTSVTSIGLRAFRNCNSLTSVIIPNSVTSIGDDAFYGCSSLTSVTIPYSVIFIGSYAFYGCNGLTEINCLGAIAPTLGGSVVFSGVTNTIPVNIPCGSISSYQSVWTYFNNFIETPQYTLYAQSNNEIMGNVNITGAPCDSIAVMVATANYGYHFTQWNDGNTNNPRTIILTQDTSFTAQFEKNQYTVNVVPSHTERGSVTGGNTVDYLDSITITATANYGYHFDHWNDMNTDNPRQVQVTQDHTYTAYFDYNQYSITLNVDTSIHGTCSGGGSYNYLSNRTIAANANYGYHFTQWNDGNTNNPRTITLIQDTSFTAQFAKNQYTVNVAASHTDRGNVTGGGTVYYLDSVTATAIANYGYHFDHWSDGSAENPHTVAVTQNVTLTAFFVPNQYALAVVSADETGGHVSGGGNYDYMSNRTITATPNYGYHFTQWNDGVATSTRTITLTQDTTFTASFAPNQYNLTAVSADETMGTVSGGGTYDYGNNITVTANPVEHFHFLHWNDGNTDNPRTVVIEGDRTLTAFFAIDTHTVSVTVNDISRGMVEASGTEFVYGTPCTVTATAYSGYVFSHWSNNVTYNPYTFAVMEDVELTAIFVEEGTQGISDVSDINGFKVYTKGCSIHINGIEGQYVSVYSVDGRIIATKQNTTEQEPIPVPTTGVYFIKVGEYPARKVIVVR